jgi:hypothetical protein
MGANINLNLSKDEMIRMFDLTPRYSLEQLKHSYKRLVIKNHPDKNIGNIQSTPVFQLITACFKTLFEDLKTREQQKEHDKLQATFKQERDQYRSVKSSEDTASNIKTSKSFNSKKFNQIYEQNRMRDPNDEGYGKWKSSANTINETRNNTLIIHQEPQPSISTSSSQSFLELGVDKYNDFSSQTQAQKHLSYMDLRIAHTTKQLVDDSLIKTRKHYNNVQELEVDRANVQHVMSDKDMRKYVKYQTEQDKLEKQRLQKLALKDRLIENNFQKSNQHLLSVMRN